MTKNKCNITLIKVSEFNNFDFFVNNNKINNMEKLLKYGDQYNFIENNYIIIPINSMIHNIYYENNLANYEFTINNIHLKIKLYL